MRTGMLGAAFLTALPGLLLGGCSGGLLGRSDDLDALQGDWVVTRVVVQGEDYGLPIGGRPPSFVVEDESLRGFGGVNTFAMDVDEADDGVAFSLAEQTFIGQEGMAGALEQALFFALDAASSAERDGDNLVITGDDVRVDLEPASKQDVDLSGRWDLMRLETADEMLTFPPGDGPSFSLLGNQANSGCQVNVVRAEVEGSDVTFVVVSSGSMMSCPPFREDFLDGEYPTYLEQVQHGSRDGDTLVLTGDDLELTYALHGSG